MRPVRIASSWAAVANPKRSATALRYVQTITPRNPAIGP
jgi:hypothetical protein